MKKLIRFFVVSIIVSVCSVAFGQLPLPFPFPDPLGLFGGSNEESGQAAGVVVDLGMQRKPAGDPPYGLTPAGTPYWPMSDPPPAKKAPETSVNLPAAQVSAQMTNPSVSGNLSNELHSQNLHSMAVAGNFDGKVIGPMVAGNLEKGLLSGVQGRPVGNLSDREIESLQYSFLYDLQRRARYIFEGKDAMAAAVSSKWQLIGDLHSDKIEEITFNLAQRSNFPNFSMWIQSVVEKDKQFAENP